MNVEAIVLATASAVRPSTSLAAVYTLLSGARPRPLLVAFITAGFLVSTAIGVLVVSVLHGIPLPGAASQRADIVDVVAGAAMLGFGAGAWSGQVELMRRRHTAGTVSRWAELLQQPSLKVAAVAGVATHLPGLFYLVALNAIAADGPPTAGAVVQVLVYNAIWFSVPAAALLLAERHAVGAQEHITRLNAWLRRHEQVLLVAVFVGVGTYLVVKGIRGLVS
ncbi:MAG TPA: GAP family protein [Solirubrobacteraceae bacterium]|jgi:hypothetical protein|nr:GAP family protein [Solirubrobacteraceae bacterium]